MSVAIVYTRRLRLIKDKEDTLPILKGILENLRTLPNSVDEDPDGNAPDILAELEEWDKGKIILWEIERILKGKTYQSENSYLYRDCPKFTGKTWEGKFFYHIRHLISVPTISDEEAKKLEELDEEIKAQSKNMEELPF